MPIRKGNTLKNIWSGYAIALAIVVLSSPVISWAGDVSRVSEQSVEATLFDIDDAGCVQTFVFVFAISFRNQNPPGAGSESAEGFVVLSRFDDCTGEEILDGIGGLSSADIKFRGTAAQVTGAVPVFDFVSNAVLDLFVDLEWEAVGPARPETDHFHSRTAESIVNRHYLIEFRPAVVSGSLSLEGVDLELGTEFAGMRRVKAGTVVIN